MIRYWIRSRSSAVNLLQYGGKWLSNGQKQAIVPEEIFAETEIEFESENKREGNVMGFGFFGFGRKKTDKKQDEQKEQIPKELAAYRAAIKTEEEQGFEAAKDMYIMAAENGSREAWRASEYLSGRKRRDFFRSYFVSVCG